MRNADLPFLKLWTLALIGSLGALSGVGCSIAFFVGAYASPSQAQILLPLSSNDISLLFPLTEERAFATDGAFQSYTDGAFQSYLQRPGLVDHCPGGDPPS
jgi:hypothetical protein